MRLLKSLVMFELLTVISGTWASATEPAGQRQWLPATAEKLPPNRRMARCSG